MARSSRPCSWVLDFVLLKVWRDHSWCQNLKALLWMFLNAILLSKAEDKFSKKCYSLCCWWWQPANQWFALPNAKPPLTKLRNTVHKTPNDHRPHDYCLSTTLLLTGNLRNVMSTLQSPLMTSKRLMWNREQLAGSPDSSLDYLVCTERLNTAIWKPIIINIHVKSLWTTFAA